VQPKVARHVLIILRKKNNVKGRSGCFQGFLKFPKEGKMASFQSSCSTKKAQKIRYVTVQFPQAIRLVRPQILWKDDMQHSKDTIASDSLVARLYELHAPALFAYLRRQVASQEDAEDILVDVFVAAVEADILSRLTEKEQVAWLWRVARNKVVDAYRRARVRQDVDLALVTDAIYDDVERAPEQVTLRHEEYAHLRTQLEKLSPIQQEALRLRFAGDLRCSEIATILGKREGAVRVMLSRALNFLRHLYENDPERSRS